MKLPKKPCPTPRCPGLREPGEMFCAACRAQNRGRTENDRASAADRGYDSAHRRWREAVLAKDPLCVECLKTGNVRPATVADHIEALRDGDAPHDLDNGQGLCATCHNRKTAEEKRRWQTKST